MGPKYIKFTKVCSKVCRIQNEPFQNGQSSLASSLSGEISPNLVTLSTDQLVAIRNLKELPHWGAAIAQWIRLRLPSCRPGFESQAHHLRFFQFKLFKLYICHLNWNVKRTKINKKRPGLAHFF